MAKTDHLVVCISRQLGSGGREIGRTLAETMGIKFLDKELLESAAERSGITQELFEQSDEKPASNMLNMMPSIGGNIKALNYTEYMAHMPNDQMQSIVADVIREAANTEPCIIIGRCADYILRGRPNMLSVFIHADLDYRIRQMSRLLNISEDASRSLVRKTDRNRANYYSYYTDRDWSSANNYHLSINSAFFNTERSAKLIQAAALLL